MFKMEIGLQEFIEIVDLIKKYDGEYTKEELWERYKELKQENEE